VRHPRGHQLLQQLLVLGKPVPHDHLAGDGLEAQLPAACAHREALRQPERDQSIELRDRRPFLQSQARRDVRGGRRPSVAPELLPHAAERAVAHQREHGIVPNAEVHRMHGSIAYRLRADLRFAVWKIPSALQVK
jgi:hypothetical protein